MTINMRKILAIVTVIAVFFTFASCGKSTAQETAQQSAAAAVSAGTGNGGTENSAQGAQTAQAVTPAQDSQAAQTVTPAQDSQSGQQAQSAQAAPQSQTAQTAQTAQGSMSAQTSQTAQTSDPVTIEGGSYSVDILSAWIDKDYTGNQVIVVKFNFTNKGSNSACFGDATRVTVKQNGSTLNGDGIIMDSSSFGGYSFNFRTPVSNGASVTCVYAYPYSSAADLDVSVRLVTSDNACTTLGSGSATISIG